MANKLFKKTSSGTSSIKFYKKTSTGLVQCPVYRKTSSGMERLDQTLVTKTKVFSGYPDWSGSFRNSTGTGTFTNSYSDSSHGLRIYQGKYSSYHHLGVMCFKTIFDNVRDFGGEVTKVTLKLTNTHSYYGVGLGTKICGAWNMTTTRPTSFSINNVKSTSYCGTVEFSKGATKTITLDENARKNIQSGDMTGFRLLSPTGFSLADYGYFEGSNANRPYIKITVQYQVWE